VAREAAVLLVVGTCGTDADPLRTPRVLAVAVPAAFADGALAERGGDDAPGLALPFEAGRGIVLLGLAELLLVSVADGGNLGRVVVGRLLCPAVRREAGQDYYE